MLADLRFLLDDFGTEWAFPRVEAFVNLGNGRLQLLGKGTEWARLTLETRGTLYRTVLDRNAGEAGIGKQEWDAAQGDPRAAAILERDIAEGIRLDIAALPAVFLNGNLIDWSRLRRAIER